MTKMRCPHCNKEDTHKFSLESDQVICGQCSKGFTVNAIIKKCLIAKDQIIKNYPPLGSHTCFNCEKPLIINIVQLSLNSKIYCCDFCGSEITKKDRAYIACFNAASKKIYPFITNDDLAAKKDRFFTLTASSQKRSVSTKNLNPFAEANKEAQKKAIESNGKKLQTLTPDEYRAKVFEKYAKAQDSIYEEFNKDKKIIGKRTSGGGYSSKKAMGNLAGDVGGICDQLEKIADSQLIIKNKETIEYIEDNTQDNSETTIKQLAKQRDNIITEGKRRGAHKRKK